jgi:hypothetical protein
MKTFLPSRLFLTWIITMVASLTLGFPLIPGNVHAAGRGKPPPSTDPPPPTAPPARYWHAFTDNGSENTATSKLFMLGGDGADAKTLADFWYYTAESEEWVLAPTGKSKPGKRKHAGLSCGAGECVTANGNTASLIEETWVYAEVPGTWSKINCRKELCPSARTMVTMAYDPGRFYHLLFGGLGGQGNLDDTYSFAGGAWMREEPADQPAARRSAAMAYVSSPVNGIVLHGGQEQNVSTLCDIWTWNGDNWQLVTASGTPAPCLHSHNMAWDGTRLMVTGGYVDVSDTPNNKVWYFTFDDDTSSGNWSYGPDPTGCYAAVKPGARMAHDHARELNVFFGGTENGPNGTIAYDETITCH